MEPKFYYRRALPHMVPAGATLFITFRLAGTLPLAVLKEYRAERAAAFARLAARPANAAQQAVATQTLNKRLFLYFDSLLDGNPMASDWLRRPEIGQLVMAEIYELAQLEVEVVCFCVMHNHVHLLVQLPETPTFSFIKMMQRLKGRTALAANRLLRRVGQPFWQAESYDHIVRSTRELANVKTYILNNPVKAGLVENWEDWPFSFLAD